MITTQTSFLGSSHDGPVNQDEINSILWKACDTFRGTIDPSEYKNYILVMLFLKYISDAWAERYAQLKQQYGDDDVRIRRQLRFERFVLPEHCDYDTLYHQRNEPNVGELINMTLERIEDENKEKLEGVFRNIDFNSEAALGRTKQRNERLKHLLEDFHDPRLDMRPSRIGGEVMQTAGLTDPANATPKGMRHSLGVNAVTIGIPLNKLQKG